MNNAVPPSLTIIDFTFFLCKFFLHLKNVFFIIKWNVPHVVLPISALLHWKWHDGSILEYTLKHWMLPLKLIDNNQEQHLKNKIPFVFSEQKSSLSWTFIWNYRLSHGWLFRMWKRANGEIYISPLDRCCLSSDHLKKYFKLKNSNNNSHSSSSFGFKTSLEHEPYFNGSEEHDFIHWSIAWVIYLKYWMVLSVKDACVRIWGFLFHVWQKALLRICGVLFFYRITKRTPDIMLSCVYVVLNSSAAPLLFALWIIKFGVFLSHSHPVCAFSCFSTEQKKTRYVILAYMEEARMNQFKIRKSKPCFNLTIVRSGKRIPCAHQTCPGFSWIQELCSVCRFVYKANEQLLTSYGQVRAQQHSQWRTLSLSTQLDVSVEADGSTIFSNKILCNNFSMSLFFLLLLLSLSRSVRVRVTMWTNVMEHV